MCVCACVCLRKREIFIPCIYKWCACFAVRDGIHILFRVCAVKFSFEFIILCLVDGVLNLLHNEEIISSPQKLLGLKR